MENGAPLATFLRFVSTGYWTANKANEKCIHAGYMSIFLINLRERCVDTLLCHVATMTESKKEQTKVVKEYSNQTEKSRHLRTRN